MNNKKQFFLLFNIFLVLIVLAINNYALYFFDSLSSIYITIFITIISALIYYIISNSIIEDVFTIEKKLKYKIETTMHEINTPVSTIQINTDILLSKVDDDKNKERLNRINKACENLFKLYEDMEYYIKKEIDYIEISDFNLQDILNHIALQFNDIKEDIQINIKVDNSILKTDKNGFEIIISNLISNAIKHNDKISEINIILQDDILTIEDDGEGINSKHIYNIFDKYYQENQENKGFGLGLSLVKEFCDKQKIDIKINSSSNGTSFKLNLKNIIKRF
ncbi:MAG: HAMP domain-containing histidine kinase [Campylobacteraceae bacterium]|jgi:signal transduction histidine kinase|nr:HAMP domain-containing histidine kinase [Campylobacteraceae bacterium]MBT4031227.1 HAMP domain-containing histidine kinase [Campylobacteraceae bacterium]MBT4179534.1 HAMP domain-containing histidine kinase [Campylobacteraceae bacterium]MBT5324130.1 HAMP domain-containing histidine kinase [Campylobacteraceae bacterium]MBT5983434.1 HAMP domain-containing histidine kinase [Campylobacteraceae bacterium]